VGSVPAAYLVTRWFRGKDIRRLGSHQVGASNVFRSVSVILAIPVVIYDLFKGITMVWVARLIGLDTGLQIAVGAAAVAGHNWSLFLGFNAGRGVLSTLGIAFFVFPWGVVPFVSLAIFTLALGSSPLPVLAGVAAIPLASYIMDRPMALTLGLLGLFLILVIRRLTAPKSAGAAGVRRRELLVSRFLYDRDTYKYDGWEIKKPVTTRIKEKILAVLKRNRTGGKARK
jgi:acyl phosphate:glycerol-3-phosphate acyltransferase